MSEQIVSGSYPPPQPLELFEREIELFNSLVTKYYAEIEWSNPTWSDKHIRELAELKAYDEFIKSERPN